MSYSCLGCKWLYFEDYGYSNYTVTNTGVFCALDQNENLPRGENSVEEPYDWTYDPENDNWPKTNKSRCTGYQECKEHIRFDVEGETTMADFEDQDQALIVFGHAGKL